MLIYGTGAVTKLTCMNRYKFILLSYRHFLTWQSLITYPRLHNNIVGTVFESMKRIGR